MKTMVRLAERGFTLSRCIGSIFLRLLQVMDTDQQRIIHEMGTDQKLISRQKSGEELKNMQ